MNRTALRALASLATVAAVALAPVSTGLAQADTRPGDTGAASTTTPDPGLAAAIRAARDDYRLAVLSTRTTLRTTMDGLRAQVQAETASGRVALSDAHARHQDEVDTALASAKSSLQTARTLFTTAVAAAYAKYAPGQAMPRVMVDTPWSPGPADRPWSADLRIATR